MKYIDAPWMTEELRILQENVDKFFASEFAPHAEKWRTQGCLDRSAWLKAGEAGLLTASIPEEFGGAGGNATHDAVIFLCQARRGEVGFGSHVHNIVAHYILTFGTDEQKRRWLPRLAMGELIGAIAMTEPGTGSDLQSITTTAVSAGDTYRLNGSKTFISNGQLANLILVVAKTNPSIGAKGVSLIALETEGAEGFRRGRNLEKIGLTAQDTSELFFDDVAVPKSNLLGHEEGQGFTQLMRQLAWERLIVAITAVGACEYALDTTLAYVKERRAFGKRIMDFQNTRFKLAEVATKLEVTKAYVDKCIQAHCKGALDAAMASMAKWWSTQVQCEIVDECLQLHGGYGYMMEYPIARLYADARIQKIYGGTNEIMKELIARSLDS
jgi:alkylation response protein AidB-like acyl-CoA dehydrogenase